MAGCMCDGVAQLKARWLDMRTEGGHRLSGDLPTIGWPLVHLLIRSVLISEARGGASVVLMPEERSMNAQGLLERIGQAFRAHPFRSLLDTISRGHTLSCRTDFARINAPDSPALLR